MADDLGSDPQVDQLKADELADAMKESQEDEAHVLGILLLFLACLLLAFSFGYSVGGPSETTLAYKGLYERSVCESKGLQVGKLDNITVCLNPETKAVYKIELPTVKKDK